MDEPQLIAGLQEGNEEAFRMLVQQHQRRVYNVCLSLLQHAEDAEDVTQEVFIEVYESISRFKGAAKLSTWLYRVSTTKCLDHLRAKKRKKRFGIVLTLFGTESNEPLYEQSSFEHPGIALEKKENSKILFAAINRLPENQRTAFTLHKIENLSYKEVADAMNLSLASVESLLFRAKQNLQKLLQDFHKKSG